MLARCVSSSFRRLHGAHVYALTEGFRTLTSEVEIATLVKKTLDRDVGPTWHVIVGTSFGSFVTHESKNFAYFYINDLGFLVFKRG